MPQERAREARNIKRAINGKFEENAGVMVCKLSRVQYIRPSQKKLQFSLTKWDDLLYHNRYYRTFFQESQAQEQKSVSGLSDVLYKITSRLVEEKFDLPFFVFTL